MDRHGWSDWIRAEAQKLGFARIGFSKAEPMEEEARRLREWLHQDRHGEMKYMARYFDLRTDPTKLVPGAKSVIVLAYNYYTSKRQADPTAPKVSMYAFGRDYHRILKRKLRNLLDRIRDKAGHAITGRCFVDSAPVLERDWARRSGIGWVGKNTLLIHPKMGSYFFLAEIILDLELEYDAPIDDYCGTCTRCIDACPTDAILPDGYILDAKKCISYLTIELRDAIPAAFEGRMDNWVFGCDICQDVCPWNRFSKEHSEPAFGPNAQLLAMTKQDWHQMTSEEFENIFSGSPLKRAKYAGISRNLRFLEGNVVDEEE